MKRLSPVFAPLLALAWSVALVFAPLAASAQAVSFTSSLGAPAGSQVGNVEAQSLVNQVIAANAAISALQTAIPSKVTPYTTVGSFTFTPLTTTIFFTVEEIANGGGGAASGGAFHSDGTTACATNTANNLCVANGGAGVTGGSVTFGSVTVTGGVGGAVGGASGARTGGAGGAISGTPSPTPSDSRTGGVGGKAPSGFFSFQAPGKGGGPFGASSVVGDGAQPCQGPGGGGAGGPDNGTGTAGSSGGEGGSAFIIYPTVASSYTGSIGALGTGGAAGTGGYAGSAGCAGKVIVREYAR